MPLPLEHKQQKQYFEKRVLSWPFPVRTSSSLAAAFSIERMRKPKCILIAGTHVNDVQVDRQISKVYQMLELWLFLFLRSARC